jgi:hypothetical protein
LFGVTITATAGAATTTGATTTTGVTTTTDGGHVPVSL